MMVVGASHRFGVEAVEVGCCCMVVMAMSLVEVMMVVGASHRFGVEAVAVGCCCMVGIAMSLVDGMMKGSGHGHYC
jgi:hypothetical protein